MKYINNLCKNSNIYREYYKKQLNYSIQNSKIQYKNDSCYYLHNQLYHMNFINYTKQYINKTKY